MTKDTPLLTSIDYDDQVCKWELLFDLYGGTNLMRFNKVKWLPQEEKENKSSYEMRVKLSFLYNALRSTIKRLASKPYSKSVTIKNDDTDLRIESIKNNVDGEATTLTQFCKNVFTTAMTYGMTHCLVDYPSTLDNNGKSLSINQEKKLMIRPYYHHIKPYELFYWDYAVDNIGQIFLKEIRFLKMKTEKNGVFGNKRRFVIVQYTTNEINEYSVKLNDETQIYDLSNFIYKSDLFNSNEIAIESQSINTLNKIPLHTFYTNKIDFMKSEPPLRDLSEINLEHFQSKSDQRNILRFARLVTLTATGVTPQEKERGFVLGVNSACISTSKDAKFGYVEINGAGAEAGRKDLQMLEEQMEVLGNQPLISRNLDSTATGIDINENAACTDVQAWVLAENRFIKKLYESAAEWLKVKLHEEFEVNIYSDFMFKSSLKNTPDPILERYDRELISHKTVLLEDKRRGIFSEDFDINLEIDLVGDKSKHIDDDELE